MFTWVGVSPDLDAPKTRVVELSVALRGEYFIFSQTTGNRIFIKADGQLSTKAAKFEQQSQRSLSLVNCSIAIDLSENLASATNEYFDATDKLANLVGQHEEFAKEKRHAESMRENCRAARLASTCFGPNTAVAERPTSRILILIP